MPSLLPSPSSAPLAPSLTAGQLVKGFAPGVAATIAYPVAAIGASRLMPQADKEYVADTKGAPLSSLSGVGQRMSALDGRGKWKYEAGDSLMKWLDSDSASWFANNPATAKYSVPLMGAMQAAGEVSLGVPIGRAVVDTTENVASNIGAPVAAGALLRKATPYFTPEGLTSSIIGAKAMSLPRTIGSGLASAAAVKANQIGQHYLGLDAEAGTLGRSNELSAPANTLNAWKPYTRAFGDIASGASAGAATGGAPGAIGGAVYGATQEPTEQYRALQRINEINNRAHHSANNNLLELLINPSVPLSRFGDGPGQLKLKDSTSFWDKLKAMNFEDNSLSQENINLALSERRRLSGEMDKDNRLWADPKPRSERAAGEETTLNPDSAYSPKERISKELSSGEYARLGGGNFEQAIKADEGRKGLSSALRLGGGALAAGAGIYALRKLFAKNKKRKTEEEEMRDSNFVPAAPKIARWMFKGADLPQVSSMTSSAATNINPRPGPVGSRLNPINLGETSWTTEDQAAKGEPSNIGPDPFYPQRRVSRPVSVNASPPDHPLDRMGIDWNRKGLRPDPAPPAAATPPTPVVRHAPIQPTARPTTSTLMTPRPIGYGTLGGSSTPLTSPGPLNGSTSSIFQPQPVQTKPVQTKSSIPSPIQPAAKAPAAQVEPLTPAPAAGTWTSQPLPKDTTHDGAGFHSPVTTAGGTKNVAFTPTSRQAMDFRVPGYGQMTPEQRGQSLSALPSPVRPVGQTIPNYNPPSNIKGERLLMDGTKEVDPSKELLRPHPYSTGPGTKSVDVAKQYAGGSGVGSVTIGRPRINSIDFPGARSGVIRDETGDVTAKIRGSLVDRFYGRPGLTTLKKTSGLTIPRWI
jgi:hypothetical protein